MNTCLMSKPPLVYSTEMGKVDVHMTRDSCGRMLFNRENNFKILLLYSFSFTAPHLKQTKHIETKTKTFGTRIDKGDDDFTSSNPKDTS